ncbi:hypothetical protein [Niallia sp. Krafla_26]|uniref:hypothetical protein n=1 Tax=Niallia sp. Krafla_26 TaxID=3064703 RepID=UPI003D16AA8C
MASYWTKQEQSYLVKAIPLYRQKLMHSKSIETVTKEVAEYIHQSIPDLKNKSITSIQKCLPYLDNLLAGVFEKYDYAKKDQYLYSSLPRDHGVKKPNLCKTRHKYNGALYKYLNKDKNFNIAN